MSQGLAQQLATLRNRVHTLSFQLEIAIKYQDRPHIVAVRDQFTEAYKEWDKLIKQVAQLERLTYNVNEVLAICQDEETK